MDYKVLSITREFIGLFNKYLLKVYCVPDSSHVLVMWR